MTVDQPLVSYLKRWWLVLSCPFRFYCHNWKRSREAQIRDSWGDNKEGTMPCKSGQEFYRVERECHDGGGVWLCLMSQAENGQILGGGVREWAKTPHTKREIACPTDFYRFIDYHFPKILAGFLPDISLGILKLKPWSSTQTLRHGNPTCVVCLFATFIASRLLRR